MLRHAVVLALLSTVLGAACRRQRAPAVPAPQLALQEEHCWWAVMRSPLPADSVGARFAAAFAAVGLPAIRTTRLGDTVLVESGAAPLPAPARGVWASRVVAYAKGDSTRFRHFVAWGRAGAPDSVLAGHEAIGICGAITRAAGVRGTAPREPTGEETEPVWSRRSTTIGSGT